VEWFPLSSCFPPSIGWASKMNRDEKAFARIMFKHKVVTSDGQAYEDLFGDIMTRGNPDFVGVKPQGRIGDTGHIAGLASFANRYVGSL